MTGNERRPLSLLIKPVSGECNLACRYCFYRAETLMRKTRDFGRMSGKTADELIQSAVKAASGSLTFSFQGGEPTLWGLDNFRRFRDKALAAAEESAPGLDVRFTTQTNGVLIAEDNRFAEFFAENNWLVGLSIDGTPPLHDLNRPAPGGKGSYEAALKAAENLKAAGAEFNILTVVQIRWQKPSRIYNDYKSAAGISYKFVSTQAAMKMTQASASTKTGDSFSGIFLTAGIEYQSISYRKRRTGLGRRFDDLVERRRTCRKSAAAAELLGGMS